MAFSLVGKRGNVLHELGVSSSFRDEFGDGCTLFVLFSTLDRPAHHPTIQCACVVALLCEPRWRPSGFYLRLSQLPWPVSVFFSVRWRFKDGQRPRAYENVFRVLTDYRRTRRRVLADPFSKARSLTEASFSFFKGSKHNHSRSGHLVRTRFSSTLPSCAAMK
jgi:hypothetical protein